MVEDFGYQKDQEESRIGIIIKRAFLVGAILFSVSCFIYITISAYNFVYHEANNNVPTIKSPNFQIKIIEDENKGGAVIKDMDKAVYENIVGNKRESLERGAVNVIKVPDEPKLKSEIAPKIIAEPNITRTAIIDNRVPANIRGAEGDFRTIEQSAKEHSREHSSSSLTVSPASNSKIAGEKVAPDDKLSKPKKNVSRVQVAAMNSSSAADDYWRRLNAKYPALFSGLKHFVQEVNLGQKGNFYRLQIGDFRNQTEAENFCMKFIVEAQKNKADCIVVE